MVDPYSRNALLTICALVVLKMTVGQSSFLGNLKVIEPAVAKSGVIIDTAPSVVYHQSYSKINGKVVITPSTKSEHSYMPPAVIPAVRDFRTAPVTTKSSQRLFEPVYRGRV